MYEDRFEKYKQFYLAWEDAAILDEMSKLAVLPDEYTWFGTQFAENQAWNTDEALDQLDKFLALANVVKERKLSAAIPLLLERASYGDMGETMRGLRHSLEAAFNPDWNALTDICIEAAQYSQRGARLWAVRELGILRDRRAIPILFKSLRDPAILVREAAVSSLTMLCNAIPELKGDVLKELEYVRDEFLYSQNNTQKAIDSLQNT